MTMTRTVTVTTLPYNHTGNQNNVVTKMIIIMVPRLIVILICVHNNTGTAGTRGNSNHMTAPIRNHIKEDMTITLARQPGMEQEIRIDDDKQKL
jgi:hypothetical protein